MSFFEFPSVQPEPEPEPLADREVGAEADHELPPYAEPLAAQPEGSIWDLVADLRADQDHLLAEVAVTEQHTEAMRSDLLQYQAELASAYAAIQQALDRLGPPRGALGVPTQTPTPTTVPIPTPPPALALAPSPAPSPTRFPGPSRIAVDQPQGSPARVVPDHQQTPEPAVPSERYGVARSRQPSPLEIILPLVAIMLVILAVLSWIG